MRVQLFLCSFAIACAAPTHGAQPDTQSHALATRLDALEAKVAAIEDVNNVERLIRAYGYYFDKGLWKETTTLFADDAVVEIAQRGVYRGRASIERLYVQLFGHGHQCLAPKGLNNHLILQPIVTVDRGGRDATGRARIIGMVAVRDGDFMLQEGVYNLRFQKQGGIWRISSLHYFGDIYVLLPGALKQYPVPQSGVSAEVPPDAAPTTLYQSYPGYYVPEFPYPNPVTGKVVAVSECNARSGH
ncbi:MAG TPA: nuclear transport factor 2 family protein [Steroidobacteraceae bacterium]|nr:nuclear transport factor 2 family protein [Steroidobacteraceae bacterium]